MLAFGPKFRAWAAFAVAVLLAGCVTRKVAEPIDPRQGDVAVRTLENTAADTYPEPDKSESYDSPVAFDDNAVPQYPAGLLEQKLATVRVRVRLIVDEAGRVTQVLPLDPGSSQDRLFFDSIQAAAGTWKFSPLVRFGEGAGSTTIEFSGQKQTYEGLATALPFHQDYEFTFSQRDGKGFVSTLPHH
jgi:hypothetical protein